MSTLGHYYAKDRFFRRRLRNSEYRARSIAKEERENEQRARARGLLDDM